MTNYWLRSHNDLVEATLRYVIDLLNEGGMSFVELAATDSSLSRTDRSARRIESQFAHTPEPLITAWRKSRNLQAKTKPGDLILMSDRSGLGGIFTLNQLADDESERRRVWTIAADSKYLELRLTAEAHSGLPMPLESVIDWEITQYRFSDRVLATSQKAVDMVADLGVDAELIGSSEAAAPHGAPSSEDIWVPEPVSRRARTGDILRATASMDNATVTVSTSDAEDGIWTGTTWEALRHSRAVLADRIRRADQPNTTPTAIVLGDPFSPPDSATSTLRDAGVPAVVPTGSVSAILWPDATTWTGASDLAQALNGQPRDPATTNLLSARPTESGAAIADLSRATRVSVGIPVFRDVSYLDECLESILTQDQEPTEVLIVDDGSRSTEVQEKLSAWEQRDSRIRLLQTPHRGVCVARNAALDAMTGDSFVLVDSDDILMPSFIERCANVLRSRSDLWAVATWTEFFGAYEGIEAKPPFSRRVGLRENPIISTTVLLDMAVRDQGIRFAPDLAFLFCEDWHLWSQVAAAGGKFGLVPEALAKHRVHETSGGYLRTDLAHAVGKTRATEPIMGLDRPVRHG